MKTRFIEVHPYRHDVERERTDTRKGAAAPMGGYWTRDAEPLLLRADAIAIIWNRGPVTDGSADLRFIDVNRGDTTLVVSAEEAEGIRGKLAEQGDGDGVGRELGHLTAAVRDLWTLLRARMR